MGSHNFSLFIKKKKEVYLRSWSYKLFCVVRFLVTMGDKLARLGLTLCFNHLSEIKYIMNTVSYTH